MRARLRIIFIALLIAFFECNSTSLAATIFENLDKPSTDALFFFPYNGVVVCTVKDIRVDKEEPRLHHITAIIDECLRGNFENKKLVRFWTYSDLNDAFKVKLLADVKGTQQLIAFNYSNGDNSFSLDDLVLPFGNNYKKANLNVFRKNLQKNLFQYRSCLVGEIKKSRQYKESDATFFELQFLVREVILPDKPSPSNSKFVNLQKQLADKEQFFLKCKVGQTLNIEFPYQARLKVMGRNRASGMYVLLCNPDRDWDKKCDAIVESNFKLIPLQKFDRTELAKIKSYSDLNESKMLSLHKQIGSYIEERWTPERIRFYTSRPECRDAVPFLHSKNGLELKKPRIGGQLYPELEKQLGKIVWETSVNNGEDYAHYSLFSYSTEGHVWVLAADEPFVPAQLSKEKFEEQFLKDLLFSSARGFWGVIREEYNLATKSVNVDDCHGSPSSNISIRRDKNGKPVSFECKLNQDEKLGSDGTLTAELGENLSITIVKIIGKEYQGWKNILENRVEYSNKMWHLIDAWEKKSKTLQN